LSREAPAAAARALGLDLAREASLAGAESLIA
jgi:hypothetical protein